MKPALALVAALCLAGCAAPTPPPPAPPAAAAPTAPAVPASARLLQRADEQMMAAQYRGALALYDDFLKTHANDPAAPRVRATRAVVERLLLSQTEIERLRREVDTRQAEVDRLKADLERLRRIDLRQTPAVR